MPHCVRPIFLDIWRVERSFCFWPFWLRGLPVHPQLSRTLQYAHAACSWWCWYDTTSQKCARGDFVLDSVTAADADTNAWRHGWPGATSKKPRRPPPAHTHWSPPASDNLRPTDRGVINTRWLRPTGATSRPAWRHPTTATKRFRPDCVVSR